MRDQIELRGLRVLAVVGVLEHERLAPQPLEIDLVLHADLGDAATTDELDDTIDYGAALTAVELAVAESRDLLLERLAGRIADVLLDHPRVDEAEVTVRKLRPPVASQLDSSAVTLRRTQAGRLGIDAPTHRAVLALGSNLGDREANLREAIRRLGPVRSMSQVYETEPIGGPDGQGAYLNMVIDVDTPLDPFALLRHTQRTEASAARKRETHWGARTLDVDIVFYDDVVVRAPELVIPHPRHAERPFVLAPLAEVCPDRVPDGWRERLPAMGLEALGRIDLGAPT
ncbi:MAG: 2-amino-4-hydroxy-6-hydroxymethyldihydropteridine diphosphokinase [Actinomycetota bacterium]|nr:2-amino-4-hydroxy-6-hydroxymethyldihydropteridine diphosphokinase [Actinomycetota bacterium]